jgi:hypothetical protein
MTFRTVFYAELRKLLVAVRAIETPCSHLRNLRLN